MHFQRKEFVDKTREKTVRKYIVLIVVLTMCPAVYLTFGIIKSTFYEAAANRFISDQLSFENTQVLVWPDSVDENYNRVIEQYKEFAKMYEMEYEEFVETQMGGSVEEFEAEVKKQAQEAEKEMMVVSAIAEKEGITLSDEAYEEQLVYMAGLYGYEDAEAMKEAGTEEELREIALAFLVMDFVKENSVQVKK